MMIGIEPSIIESALKKARASSRKRAIQCFHRPEERLQRMINACLYETYIMPHKHENPDKLEIFFILKGRVAFLIFDDNGKIIESIILNEDGPIKFIEIPPKTWHNLVVISPEAVLYEIIEGKYDPETHKKFAPWAPKEDEENGTYLETLRNRIKSTQSPRKPGQNRKQPLLLGLV
jgi:cupin fold WbuC family metalloprotein